MGALLACASALVAAGAVLLFTGLTRLFAALLSAPDVFPLMTCIAGGAAAGALFAHRRGWQPAGRPFAVALGAALGALFTVLATWALVGLAWLNLTLLNAALAWCAFAAAGAALATPFAVSSRRPGLVAGAQLLAAGATTAVAGPLIDALGPVDVTLAAGALCAAGAALATVPAVRRRTAGTDSAALDLDDNAGLGRRVGSFAAWGLLGTGIVAGLVALPFSLLTGAPTLDPGTANSGKSLYASVNDPQQRETVVYTRWDRSGRTDVAEPGATDEIKWVYLDGVPAGIIPRGGAGGPVAQGLRNDLGFVPFLLPGSHERVLVVGAGGGQEVVAALTGGAKEVVATEVSSGIIAAQARFAGYTGDLFAQPGVRVVPEDGRAYLRNTGEQFDVIYLTLGTFGTADAAGTLGGSYLYTLEAFDDYLRHLRNDGRLVIKLRDEPELLRAFNTAHQALTRRGATPLEAIRRMLAVNNAAAAGRGAEEGGVVLPLLIVRKTPYLEDEARQVFETLRQSPFPPIFVPHLEGLSPVLSAFAAEGLGPGAIEAQAPFQIRPATDASPYFFDPRKGPPWEVLAALVVLLLLTGGAALLSRRPGVESIEFEGDVPDTAAAFLEDDVPWRFAAFSAAVGLGFALVLYPLVHRLPLLVAESGLGLTLLVTVLTLGAAAGALLTTVIKSQHERPAIGWATLAAALVAVALLELLPMAEEATRGQTLAARATAAALLLLPLGLCAGIPFPAAVRTLDGAGRPSWATLLWGVLALAGASGVLLALLLGMTVSFTYATLLGAACLFAAFLMAGLRWLAPAAAPAAQPEPSAAPDLTPYQRPA